MTTQERASLSRLALALQSVHAQVEAMSAGTKAVPVLDMRAMATILGLVAEKVEILAGNEAITPDSGCEHDNMKMTAACFPHGGEPLPFGGLSMILDGWGGGGQKPDRPTPGTEWAHLHTVLATFL